MTNSKLRIFLNLDTLDRLPPDSQWPGYEGMERYRQLAADGFEGVQQTTPHPIPPDPPLAFCGCGRINVPGDAGPLAELHAGIGHECLTVHVGWGIEDDDKVDRLVEATLSASIRHRIPIYIETHRATITQDMWRTVKLTERFPEIRFNGDFSHYYTGQEMVYGGLDMKLDFLEPVFDRVRFIHGRIGSPGCMQVTVGDGRGRPRYASGDIDFLEDFGKIWSRAFAGFLRKAEPDETLIFCPEILSGQYYYAREFPGPDGRLREESDRYHDALVYRELARSLFSDATTLLST
jgi:hypothetical protein